jgi:hypothetical protein
MRVIDRITRERLSVDEAYERFFDGFYNLGRPEEIFECTMVLSPPKRQQVKAGSSRKARQSGHTRRAMSGRAGRK